MKARSRLAHNRNMIYLKGVGYVPRRFRHDALRGVLIFLALPLIIRGGASFARDITRTSQIAVVHAEVVSPSPVATSSATPVRVMEKPEVPETVDGYITQVFGTDSQKALRVATCESGLRKNALNKNTNGTTDHGVFQINSIHTATYGNGFKTDWKVNVQVAKKIFDKQGWGPWVCAHKLGIK